MNYLGIDIGKKTHVAGLVDDSGGNIDRTLKFSPSRTGWEKLMSYLEKNQLDKDSIQIGLEATGHYWLTLYEKLISSEFNVTVFNPLQVASFRNKGIRGQKTDPIDAVLIANVLRFGESSQTRLPDENILILRRLSRFRSNLVDQTTSIKHKISAILDQVFPEYASLFDNTFGKGSLALLKKSAFPEEIAKLDLGKLTKLLKKASRNHFDEEKARLIKDKAKISFGTRIGLDAFEIQIKILINQIEYLDEQTKKLAKELKSLVGDHVLLSIPGISHVSAGIILGEIGNFRFAGKDEARRGIKALTALAGLDPKLQESGQYQGQTKMSKRGSKYLRRAVMQSSFV
ncbi:IS110 family transposase, partial [bacterium]|nr:IS110 family transposase [bacterium]